MGESRVPPSHYMATTSRAVTSIEATTTVAPSQNDESISERVAVLTLRPNPETSQHTRKKVVWTEDTVDNEHMNKKKSKCCCIYEKPRKFGESDSEDSTDDECEHCFGHVEKKKKKTQQRERNGAGTVTIQEELTHLSEPTATLKLHPPSGSQPVIEPPDSGQDVPDSI